MWNTFIKNFFWFHILCQNLKSKIMKHNFPGFIIEKLLYMMIKRILSFESFFWLTDARNFEIRKSFGLWNSFFLFENFWILLRKPSWIVMDFENFLRFPTEDAFRFDFLWVFRIFRLAFLGLRMWCFESVDFNYQNLFYFRALFQNFDFFLRPQKVVFS